MSVATGVGSLPGEDYREAVKQVLGELPDLPHVPELPARGAIASMTGRTLAIVDALDADLQPAGWRLTGTSGAPALDHRRARSLLAQDLDTVEELTQGYAGELKLQVAGPWTLAATVERPRGDRILADHGARRELAQALAEGVATHVRDVGRRVPGARLVVQVDEPALPAVLGGRVPTASGYGRHRSVEPPEASQALEWVLAAITDAAAEPWVHSCAAGTPLDLLRGALRDARSSLADSSGTTGRGGLAVDLAVVDATGTDQLAEALEAGERVALGVVPTRAPAESLSDKAVTERVLRWLDLVGLAPEEVGDRLVVAPACGLAGADATWAREAMRLVRAAAANLG